MICSIEAWAMIIKSRDMRNLIPINHHILSSIWSSLKSDISVIHINGYSILGNGK